MARVVKVRRKRKPTLLAYVSLVFILALIVYSISSIYLRQYNVELIKEINNAEIEIVQLRSETESLRLSIDKSIYKRNVVDVAQNDNMEIRKENIIYIKGNN